MARALNASGGVDQVFTTSNPVSLRAGDLLLAQAVKTEIAVQFDAEERIALQVSLTVEMFRSEVARLAQGGVIDVSVDDLTPYAPLKPLTLIFWAEQTVLEALTRALQAGRSLEDCLTAKGDDGFPVFTDLDHYVLVEMFQKG